jgi:hypothetical protein
LCIENKVSYTPQLAHVEKPTQPPDTTLNAPEIIDSDGCATDAILGVALFKEQASNSFGRFNRAFVSMFRIAGGETWIDGLPFLDDAGDIYWKSSLFVCSYMVLNVWVVLQVFSQVVRNLK